MLIDEFGVAVSDDHCPKTMAVDHLDRILKVLPRGILTLVAVFEGLYLDFGLPREPPGPPLDLHSWPVSSRGNGWV